MIKMTDVPSLEALLGTTESGKEERLSFSFGKKAKSPFDNDDIQRPSQIDNLYERLGLENFTEDQGNVKSAYRRQVLIWHPDRNNKHKQEASKEFIALTNAYETLSNPDKKSAYRPYWRTAL